MMNFIEGHQFVTQNSYHSVVGCILIPWGYTSSYCPDDSLYRALGAEMARDSGYPVGTAWDGEYLWITDTERDSIWVLDVSESTPVENTSWGALKSRFR